MKGAVMGQDGRTLLARSEFKEAVFARDGGKCVFCNAPAEDPHHIMERRLFADGGYYLDNGASVCHEHHLACERTTISVEEVRKACGIREPLLPDHLYPEETYDKWGNPVLSNGRRLAGELFHEEGVQKALAEGGVLGLFTNLVKYPRTNHAPWSSAVQSDDKVIPDLRAMEGERIIGTVKKDGENTTLYRSHFHARSVDSRHHPSRDWVKNFWSAIRYDIPENWRVCGENLFARHSIAYESLPSFFMGFSVWNDRNVALSWDETLEWFELLGITPVETVYDGPLDPEAMKRLGRELFEQGEEGVVFRVAREIHYREFPRMVIKDVRPGHVQTKDHWMYGAGLIEQNRMAGPLPKP